VSFGRSYNKGVQKMKKTSIYLRFSGLEKFVEYLKPRGYEKMRGICPVGVVELSKTCTDGSIVYFYRLTAKPQLEETIVKCDVEIWHGQFLKQDEYNQIKEKIRADIQKKTEGFEIVKAEFSLS
jgi:hypothetical protein